MQVPAERRRKYFVDRQVQGAVLRQAVCYWLFGSVTFTLVVFVYRIVPHCLSGEGLDLARIWYHMGPMAISSAVLLPVVMFSAIRFSSRLAGQMVRFRRALRQLARGETAPLLKIRRDDFWSNMAIEINQVSAKLCELSGNSKSSGNSQETDELVEEPRCV